MRKISLIATFIVFVLAQKTFAQDTARINGLVSLKKCIDIALRNNADINRSELAMMDSKVTYNQSQGNRLPFISGGITHGLSQGRAIDPFTNSYINQNLSYANYNLGADLYLWNAGSVSNNIKANRLNYEAGKMDWQQQKDNVTINVILAYLQVLNATEQLNAAIQLADVTRKQVERLELLNNDGAIAPATYYDTKGQLATDEANIVTLKNTVESARISLVQLMNINYSKDMQLEKVDESSALSLYDGNSNDIYQTALNNLAMIKAVDLRRASATKSLKAAKGQMYPSLVLSGGLGTNYSSAASTSTLISVTDVATGGYVNVNNEKLQVYAPQSNFSSAKIPYDMQWKNNFNSSVSVGIQIPILNGLVARSRVKTARNQEKRATLNATTAKTQLQQSVEQAYLNMNTAFERYQKVQAQVDALSISFTAAEVKFNAGAINSVEYLLVKNRADNAKINLIAAKYDYILRTKILDFYKGTLSL
ncbi:TolC family protein [Panacibacter sp. DH6]|uniref:TolC family protein n=1 Tax=Panacibacter microcysteis TaxID=2793269 RepID=A0A931E9R2_9BACT|nr:TolC family protein [Panacibacter microcysteis]MBG9377764.1 TolC family protein [Panacibacter microcysteis]